MLSLGIEASRAFWTASASRGLPSTSPPPSLAAVVICRASFVKSLPRRESTIAFLCLIDAHLEWPDMLLRVLEEAGQPGVEVLRPDEHALARGERPRPPQLQHPLLRRERITGAGREVPALGDEQVWLGDEDEAVALALGDPAVVPPAHPRPLD